MNKTILGSIFFSAVLSFIIPLIYAAILGEYIIMYSVPFYLLLVFFATLLYLKKQGSALTVNDILGSVLFSSPLLAAGNLFVIYSGLIKCSDWCGIDIFVITLPSTGLFCVIGLFILIARGYRKNRTSDQIEAKPILENLPQVAPLSSACKDFLKGFRYSSFYVALSIVLFGITEVFGSTGLGNIVFSILPLISIFLVFLLVSNYLRAAQVGGGYVLRAAGIALITYSTLYVITLSLVRGVVFGDLQEGIVILKYLLFSNTTPMLLVFVFGVVLWSVDTFRGRKFEV